MREHGVTTTFMVPAHLQRLFADEPSSSAPRLRLLAHAGAPCPPALKRRALAIFPSGSVWEFYGATEGQFTVCAPEEWEARPGTVGRARPGRRLEVDETGRIWCHVPPYARFEYWRDPERTAEAWRGDAFTVGDLGRLDDDGYLFIDGRRDDLVISGGVNVYPQEVEQTLEQHPAVAEAAVYGAPHPEWGQQVCALVVPAFGQPLDPDGLISWLKERLAGYKVPRRIDLVDELPRTPTGKIRRDLKAPG